MFKDSLNKEYRWPRKGDRLLRSSNGWDKHVIFSKSEITRGAQIWSGYMRAGVVMVEECRRDGSARHDLLYPILYCYRHALEVAMKWILSQYGHYADLKQYEMNHDLWQLWKMCRKVISDVGGDDSDETIEGINAVENVVKELHELDPRSFAFRYATNRKGATIKLPDDPIDLENIKDVMEAVNNFFVGADGLLAYNSSASGY